MTYITLIELQNNKYYVICTEKKNFNIESLYKNNIEDWILINKALSIKSSCRKSDNRTLDECVMIYMSTYGMNNVRGGSFSNVILTNEQKGEIWEYMTFSIEPEKPRWSFLCCCKKQKPYKKPLLDLNAQIS